MHKHKEDALNCGDTTPILVSLAPSRRLPDLSVERRSELSVVSPELPMSEVSSEFYRHVLNSRQGY